MKRIVSFTMITLLSIGGTLSGCKKKKEDPAPSNTTNALTFDCKNKTITSAVVWEDRGDGVDYIVNCQIEIKGGSLEIKPGVRVQFTNGEAGIMVSDGFLKANGTAAAPILLQGNTSIKGSWRGVYFFSNNAQNSLSYVKITDAGSSEWDHDLKPAGVTLANYGGTARLSIKNCNISNNAGFGVYLRDSDENLFEFASDTLKNNDAYPVRVFFQQLNKLDELSDYGAETNGENFIYVSGQQELNAALTIKKLSVPYYVEDYFGEVNFKQAVTVNPGVILTMEADYLIYVTGTLVAQGTNLAPITFKGLGADLKGTWKGLHLASQNNNVLNFCVFDGGGSSDMSYAAKANVCVGETIGAVGKATITNCTFKNSDGFGYAYKSTANMTQSGNTFLNNTSGNIKTY